MELSTEKIRECIQLLEHLLADRTRLAEVSPEDRKALLIAAGRLSRPERLEIMKLAKTHRKKKYRKDRSLDRSLRAATEIRSGRLETVYTPALQKSPEEIAAEPKKILLQPRSCYICKAEFNELHFFYDALCPACADTNYAKRFQTADLTGTVSLLTGARLKIGYQAALMLLRAGSSVIVTTRFPKDAAIRYSREKDFDQWGNRLQIYGLDLRHSPSVELFCRYIVGKERQLDFLINNAAQTVRRPPGFYAHLLPTENTPFEKLPASARYLLRGYEDCIAHLRGESTTREIRQGNWITTWQSELKGSGIGIKASAALSQIPYQSDEFEVDRELFPEGKLDADLQQQDLRAMNSWRLTLAQVSTPELVEIQLVNAIAPFILCAKLKPLMLQRKSADKHIVNVSAMEGKFTRYTKTDKHPHTNMAKASLNMMTLTSAPDYAKDGIFMNAVDTGWVTDEDPHQLSQRKQAEHDFQPPLDIVDGAARVCDPIFHGWRTGEHAYGKFFKDYVPTTW